MSERFGEWLRSHRQAHGWAQAQVGKRLRDSQATISEWEAGRSVPGGDDRFNRDNASLKSVLPPKDHDRQTLGRTRLTKVIRESFPWPTGMKPNAGGESKR